VSREAIWTSVFGLVSALAPFKSTGRKVVIWDDCPAMPALYLNQGGESVIKTGRGLPNIYTMSAEIVLYARNESNGTPATQINALLDAVTARFAVDPIDGKQTLGGLVEDAWIEGEIMRDEGALGDVGVALVPIKVQVIF
jgi:hypothetical protein